MCCYVTESVHPLLKTQTDLWKSPLCLTMISFLLFAALCTSCLGNPVLVHFSYTGAVGGGSGSSFSSDGEGRVTAVRMWEVPNSYITGIQLRYNHTWSRVLGRVYGHTNELRLFDAEVIVQISGKYYTNYIYQLMFVTSGGRSLVVGQPTQYSFNFYPIHPDAELRLLSGRFNGNGITSLGAHWGVVFMYLGNSTGVITK